MNYKVGSIFIIFLILLVAINNILAKDGDNENNLNKQWTDLESKTNTSYSEYEKKELLNWDEYKKRIFQKWEDGAIPEQKIFVKYFDDDSARIKVDYEKGIVIAESLQEKSQDSISVAKLKIKKSLESIIETKSSPNAVLNSDEIIPQSRKKNKDEIINQLIEHIDSSETQKAKDGKVRQLYRITFNLIPNYIQKRADKLRPAIQKWSEKYKLDSSFVLGLIRQESSFNPRARSNVGAIGLMQIMPQFAGQEVIGIVTGTKTIPTSDFLYDPENNIMIGTTYIQILRDQYLSEIKDPIKNQYLTICSYNWGPHRIQKALSNGKINSRLPANEIFDRLEQITPAETKNYLKRVTQFAEEFRNNK